MVTISKGIYYHARLTAVANDINFRSFPLKALARGSNGSVDPLCQRLRELTGSDADVVKKAIDQFVRAGYIKSRQEGENLVWYWTHNNKIDCEPS